MHPETFDTIKAIAHLQKEAGNLSDAETTFIQIYGRMEEKLGDEHPETLRAQNDLAEIYLKSDKAEEAFGLSERLLETELRVLGKEDPLTLRTEARLSELHFLAGRLEEALEGFTTVIATQERILGFDHPEVARSRDFLNQILARRAAATGLADSNLTEAKPFQGPLLAESVLPPKTTPAALLPTELEPNIAEEDKEPGTVNRLIGNIKSAIGSNGTKETARENER
jgi:tetratricopeptide (TPR) repeat protein